MKWLRIFATALLALPALSQDVAGLWDAELTANGAQVPFKVQFSGGGKALKGWFFDGDGKTISTGGEVGNGKLLARFAQYNSRLEADVAGASMQGKYVRDGKTYPFKAVRHVAPAAPTGPVPNIAGAWSIETGNDTGEKAWHFVVRQNDADVTGAILRVDGDTGELTGRFANGSFTMSHFSGARPSLFVFTPAPDGTLDVVQNSTKKMKAVRPGALHSGKEVPPPDDPMLHTSMKNPKEPLKFSFPDLNGKLVSLSDARFKGKVVIVSIGGSWCPNCHDEAPLLGELYRQYHAKGFEIVELSYEEAEQLANPTRLREFVKDYKVQYPVLLAGEIEALAQSLPQAQNLDKFPTTFFVGRDGLVHKIHSGYAGKATGHLHDELVKGMHATVRELLAAK